MRGKLEKGSASITGRALRLARSGKRGEKSEVTSIITFLVWVAEWMVVEELK